MADLLAGTLHGVEEIESQRTTGARTTGAARTSSADPSARLPSARVPGASAPSSSSSSSSSSPPTSTFGSLTEGVRHIFPSFSSSSSATGTATSTTCTVTGATVAAGAPTLAEREAKIRELAAELNRWKAAYPDSQELKKIRLGVHMSLPQAEQLHSEAAGIVGYRSSAFLVEKMLPRYEAGIERIKRGAGRKLRARRGEMTRAFQLWLSQSNVVRHAASPQAQIVIMTGLSIWEAMDDDWRERSLVGEKRKRTDDGDGDGDEEDGEEEEA